MESKVDVHELKSLIEEHVQYTGSERGKEILENFTEYLPKFKQIIPDDYKRMTSLSIKLEEQGMSTEQAAHLYRSIFGVYKDGKTDRIFRL